MYANLLRGTLDFILLKMLDGGSKYGLELIDIAKTKTEDYFTFKEGSLYPALHRLQEQKLVTSSLAASDIGGPKRRYYRLTKLGRKALQEKVMEWQKFSEMLDAL